MIFYYSVAHKSSWSYENIYLLSIEAVNFILIIFRVTMEYDQIAVHAQTVIAPEFRTRGYSTYWYGVEIARTLQKHNTCFWGSSFCICLSLKMYFDFVSFIFTFINAVSCILQFVIPPRISYWYKNISECWDVLAKCPHCCIFNQSNPIYCAPPSELRAVVTKQTVYHCWGADVVIIAVSCRHVTSFGGGLRKGFNLSVFSTKQN